MLEKPFHLALLISCLPFPFYSLSHLPRYVHADLLKYQYLIHSSSLRQLRRFPTEHSSTLLKGEIVGTYPPLSKYTPVHK